MPLRCKGCGQFLGKNHICANVDLKGLRFCSECKKPLRNTGYQRWKYRCPSCEKRFWRSKDRELRHRLIEQFGGKCSLCDYNKYEFCLEFHHISIEDKKGKRFLNEIVKNPDKFQLLCNRCHRELHIENHTLGGMKNNND